VVARLSVWSEVQTCIWPSWCHCHSLSVASVKSRLLLPFTLLAHLGTKGKGSPYSITERRVPELIPVLGRQPAGDVSHKTSGRLPLLSARPAVTLSTLKRAATNFTAPESSTLSTRLPSHPHPGSPGKGPLDAHVCVWIVRVISVMTCSRCRTVPARPCQSAPATSHWNVPASFAASASTSLSWSGRFCCEVSTSRWQSLLVTLWKLKVSTSYDRVCPPRYLHWSLCPDPTTTPI